MTFYESLGALSGGTLGYIVAGRRGLKYGSNYGRLKASEKFTNRMVPIPNARKRKNSVSAGNKRRVSNVKKRKFTHKASIIKNRSTRSGVDGYRGLGGNPDAVYKKRNRAVKQVRRSTPKVSRQFKAKVTKALMGTVYGEYTKSSVAKLGPLAAADTQNTFNAGYVFQPIDFLDAADILFDQGVPIFTPTLATVKWTNSFARKDVVVDTFASYEMKNFSQRSYTIKMYNCAPKGVIQNEITSDALDQWKQGLSMANSNGCNPQNNTFNELFLDPRQNAEFNAHWSSEVTEIVLSPGATYTFRVPGPKGIEIDFTKLITLPVVGVAVILPYSKFTRSVFFVYYPDIVTTTLSGVGRYPSTGAGTGGLGYERKVMYKIRCPSDAGFKYPAAPPAGSSQQLNLRIPVRVNKYFGSGVAGQVQDVFEENPITQVDPID